MKRTIKYRILTLFNKLKGRLSQKGRQDEIAFSKAKQRIQPEWILVVVQILMEYLGGSGFLSIAYKLLCEENASWHNMAGEFISNDMRFWYGIITTTKCDIMILSRASPLRLGEIDQYIHSNCHEGEERSERMHRSCALDLGDRKDFSHYRDNYRTDHQHWRLRRRKKKCGMKGHPMIEFPFLFHVAVGGVVSATNRGKYYTFIV